MAKNLQTRGIRLRGGITFTAVFQKRSYSSVVVTAENRSPMRVKKRGPDEKWAASVDGTGTIYYHDDPSKAFAACAAAKWRKPNTPVDATAPV